MFLYISFLRVRVTMCLYLSVCTCFYISFSSPSNLCVYVCVYVWVYLCVHLYVWERERERVRVCVSVSVIFRKSFLSEQRISLRIISFLVKLLHSPSLEKFHFFEKIIFKRERERVKLFTCFNTWVRHQRFTSLFSGYLIESNSERLKKHPCYLSSWVLRHTPALCLTKTNNLEKKQVWIPIYKVYKRASTTMML